MKGRPSRSTVIPSAPLSGRFTGARNSVLLLAGRSEEMWMALPDGPCPQSVQRIKGFAPTDAALTERDESGVEHRVPEDGDHERRENGARPGPTQPPRQD